MRGGLGTTGLSRFFSKYDLTENKPQTSRDKPGRANWSKEQRENM